LEPSQVLVLYKYYHAYRSIMLLLPRSSESHLHLPITMTVVSNVEKYPSLLPVRLIERILVVLIVNLLHRRVSVSQTGAIPIHCTLDNHCGRCR